MKKKLMWGALIVSVLLLCAYTGASWYLSGLIVDFQGRTLEQSRVHRDIESVAALGFLEPETVNITSDGVTLVGWLFRNPSGKRCGVVASHGHRGARYAGVLYGALFYRRGCHLLAYDARHHGESRAEYGTYGYHERHDLVRVVEHFETAVGLQRREIGLFGLSMGGAISLQAAALMPEIAFVAADSPYADLQTILRQRGEDMYGWVIGVMTPGALWFAEWRSDADFDDVSARNDAAHLDMPVFLLHSRADTYTLPEHSQNIYDALSHDRKELHLTDWGAPHARSLNVNPTEYQALLYSFLDRHAPGF